MEGRYPWRQLPRHGGDDGGVRVQSAGLGRIGRHHCANEPVGCAVPGFSDGERPVGSAGAALGVQEAEQLAEVDRLISLGTSRVDWEYPDDADFVVLADPEGNLFCVIDAGR